MKKASILLVALMVVAILFTGCAAKAPAAAATEAASALPGEGETYVVIGSLFQLEFFDALGLGPGEFLAVGLAPGLLLS